MRRTPSRCILWTRTPVTNGHIDNFIATGSDLVETFVDTGHFSRRLLRCRECGQLYVKEFHEIEEWSTGNDAQYTTLVPVETPEEIEAVRKADVLRIMDFVPQLRVDWPSDEDAPRAYWHGKEQ